VWNVKNWTDVMIIEEDFAILTSSNRYCNAIIHDSLYKVWSNKILKDFSDDFHDDDDDDSKSEEKDHDQD
jgi:hypothetical protein